jgi:hypothetical protein
MTALRFLSRHWGKLLLAAFVFWLFGFIDYVDEAVESMGLTSERMAAIQKGERLAPFPRERSNLKVTHSTGMFHDTYSIYFKAKPNVVSSWMDDSPGIKEAKTEVKPDGSTCYRLGPGRGFVYIACDRTEVGIAVGFTIDSPYAHSPIPPRH